MPSSTFLSSPDALSPDAHALSSGIRRISLDDDVFAIHSSLLDESDDSAHDDSVQQQHADEEEVDICLNIGKSSHKLEEEKGLHAEEPLLKANGNRFVLFPIQDSEVCTVKSS